MQISTLGTFLAFFKILSDCYQNPIGIPDSYRTLIILGGECKVLVEANVASDELSRILTIRKLQPEILHDKLDFFRRLIIAFVEILKFFQ